MVTGVTGQDGRYLVDHLRRSGYDVYGLVHRTAAESLLFEESELIRCYGNILDQVSLIRALDAAQPDEVYNLAAAEPPSVPLEAELAMRVNGLGVLQILEAVRIVNGLSASGAKPSGQTRIFQASSAAMFGRPDKEPQDESTKLAPVDPFGSAKAYGHMMTRTYRHKYGMHASAGIMFNHESPRRKPHHFARHVAAVAVMISRGARRHVSLKDLDRRVEWGFSADHMRAAHAIIGQPEAGDYVVGVGETHSYREFVELAFAHVGLNWEEHVRPAPGPPTSSGGKELRADATKALTRLGWRHSTSFEELVMSMVEAERARVSASTT
ncbi:GDP-mannose 4,6-dehydratase [Actinoallomurus iriomotensis]|uniref:GDP-mannose 4,6-dehydratase n=1 Tax=Actinoallomurus iriomotensis TaxID=478107 RepID=A0A9W6RIY4_9ACTN|nr:GDP-mannose 4,6-dehydratase [Actinoallomurus iriomotensis]GLY76946.1 GDP-mannose 4,6-dehydratase [Actinoallomurus iriomotensis]